MEKKLANFRTDEPADEQARVQPASQSSSSAIPPILRTGQRHGDFREPANLLVAIWLTCE